MELTTAARPARLSLPPPPTPRAVGRQPAASVLDALLSPAAVVPSVLDVDPARLAAASALYARPPQPAAGRAPTPPPDDEAADRRVERVRLLVTGGATAAVGLISAGALQLAF